MTSLPQRTEYPAAENVEAKQHCFDYELDKCRHGERCERYHAPEVNTSLRDSRPPDQDWDFPNEPGKACVRCVQALRPVSLDLFRFFSHLTKYSATRKGALAKTTLAQNVAGSVERRAYASSPKIPPTTTRHSSKCCRDVSVATLLQHPKTGVPRAVEASLCLFQAGRSSQTGRERPESNCWPRTTWCLLMLDNVQGHTWFFLAEQRPKSSRRSTSGS